MTDARVLRLVALAEAQHGVFGSSQASDVGLDKHWLSHQISIGRVRRLGDGACAFAGTPLAWRGELLAAVWAGGQRGRATHRSAAALLGLPGGRRDLIEITCVRWRRVRHDGVVPHETKAFDPVDHTVVDGIPCTTCARTLIDLGAVVSPAVVEFALDHAVRKELATIGELQRTLKRVAARGRNGVGVLRELLDKRTPGRASESIAERRMVRMLVGSGLPEPTLQHEIWDGSRFVARVDAAYPQWKIAVEYESFEHHMGRAAHLRDNRRLNAIQRLGWRYIAVTNADLQQGCFSVCAAINDLRRLAS